MQKNNDKKVPQLRFKGFDGDWEGKMLGDFLSFKNGINASKEQYGKGYKFINVLDIINNDFIFYDRIIGKVDVSKKAFQKSLVNYGDILFQRSSETREEVGQSNVYLDKEHTATFGGFVIRGQKTAPYDPKYLHYILKTQKVRKQIMVRSGGSTRYNVSQSILREVPLYITPCKEEQQKIANFLSDFDKKISLLEQKTEQLKAFKKGMMQQLFSQKLRFKDENGEDFPAWEVKRLGDLGTTFNGLSGKTKKDFGTGCKFITYKQIFDSASINVNNFQFVKINQGEKQHKVRKGDIFFTTSSETAKDAGFSSVILQDVENLYLNSFCFGYRPNSFELLHPLFSKYLFRNELFRRKITKLAQGTTRFNISKVKTMLLQVELPFLPEQKKIAACLSSIDQQIQGVRAQLEATKTYKKGLLQQLLV